MKGVGIAVFSSVCLNYSSLSGETHSRTHSYANSLHDSMNTGWGEHGRVGLRDHKRYMIGLNIVGEGGLSSPHRLGYAATKAGFASVLAFFA